MLWMLAQMDPKEALARGRWYLTLIVLVGLSALVFFIAMFLLRRWKHRELKAIDDRRAARRAGQAEGRTDAWAASSERYIDHDKLSIDDEPFDPEGEDEPEDADAPEHMDDEDDEDRDPFGLFDDKPYQDPVDEDDDFDDEADDFDDEDEQADEDWDEDDKR